MADAKKRTTSPGRETVLVIPRALSPSSAGYPPCTARLTPDYPPPDPLFRPDAGPRRVKQLGKPPTPSSYLRRGRQRSPRDVRPRRDFVDSPPGRPLSDRADGGSQYEDLRDYQDPLRSPQSLRPAAGSMVSRFTKTVVNDGDPLRTPISSRWSFPQQNIRPPSNHTFRTFPQHKLRRYDATPKPPKTGWSRVPRRGSIIAPPWADKRLVADPKLSDTAKWVGTHGAYAAEYSTRPMWVGYDVETESDIARTPQGPRRYIGQEPEATDTSRWVERNFGDSREWLDTPYYDGRYYQYDRRYLDADQVSDYIPNREYIPTNPNVYDERTYRTSKWLTKMPDQQPVILVRERRRRPRPRRVVPVYYPDDESSTDYTLFQRYRDHRDMLREREFYRNKNYGKKRAYPDSVRGNKGSERRAVDTPEMVPDRYDRPTDDASMFSKPSKKSYNHYARPQPPRDPGWDRYRDYGKDMEKMGPPALPGPENVHKWLNQG